MAELIIMPKLGFNMSTGKLVKWYKQVGESVKKGENLFSIETDKTNMDIEAIADGVMKKIFIPEGESLPVTLPIAIVGEADENVEVLTKEALAQLEGHIEILEAPIKEAVVETVAINNSVKDTENANTSIYDYEVLVIGGGPGGYVAAIKAAQMGKKTGIIEKEKFGGTCLNVGCIPTKALLRSAESLHEVKESGKYGVIDLDVSTVKLDMKKVQTRKVSVVNQLVEGVKGLLKGNGVTVINGYGVLINSNTVIVDGKKITSDAIIIATGSVSKSLNIPIDASMEILTSTEALDLDYIPKDMAIIGGGVIGIEFAYFLASIGTKVTVIEFLDRILPMVDEEITDQVVKMLNGMGVVIHTSAKVEQITKKSVVFEKEGKKQEVEATKVLMAVGRGPDLSSIDAEKLGIKTTRGAIATDQFLKTSVPNVYAIGDVNGKAMLAHTASMEGIVAIENICGHKSVMEYDKIPSAIYIQPEVACVGLTEKEAREKFGNVKVGKFPMFANGKAKVAGEEHGIIKVILEPKYNEIVGVHMYCIHATDMISEAVVAMKLEATGEEVAMSIHPHPTVSEAIHEAFHAAMGKAIHI